MVELNNLTVEHFLTTGNWDMAKKPHVHTEGMPEEKINFSRESVLQLIAQCQEIFKQESTLLEISAPVKIFGDIHGHYESLCRFFYNFGMPTEDIETTDYLFLGNYGDRGN